ncbi:GGDEF domain-containing protein [Pseudonocardia lacus]|uniref:GGDEF domain-containing protein n=1 Tax=Pseudonocardia lacus TaxID=2835865 RepID=UPI001BDC351B|nr:GGDEF domain-containing protein [Pseudonocardia lacus]
MSRAGVTGVDVDTESDRCALVRGDPDCRCAADLDQLTDQQLSARVTGMSRWYQRADPAVRGAAVRGIDELLRRMRVRGARTTVMCEVLRVAVLMRLLHLDRAAAGEAAALVHDHTTCAEHVGEPRLLGEAATLRAHHAAAFGDAQAALADAGTALAVLTDIERPRPGEDPAEWARLLSRSLNGLVLVLLTLDAHELADEVSRRAVRISAADGSAMDRAVHQINRTRLQLAWALRLERGGQDAAAGRRFAAAARTARSAERLWAASVDSAEPDAVAGHRCAILGAAPALRRPGPQHVDRLLSVLPDARFVHDRIVLTIALARCLLAGGRADEAVEVLRPMHVELTATAVEPALALSLHREFARAALRAGVDRPDALAAYAQALETELWALQEARLAALQGHREHHRLAREHGAVAAQAMQDPLTGLPNRRALDLTLEQVASGRAASCAVALIDLDRFKDVNDGGSHAVGDAVLREVASCLRGSLRAQDLVARYGGDEFVVVLPATSLPRARAVLQRAAAAVAALPAEAAAGVTMSVGVVAMRAGSRAADALALADAAMYRAKHAGGNAVVAGRGPDGMIPAPRRAPGG